MTRRFTRTQLLAQSVTAHVVFFRFGEEETGGDPIVAVMRNEADIEAFAAKHGRKIEYPSVYWQEISLQGSNFPYAEWPDVDELYLVTEGGIGDDNGDTEIDPVALAAFVDREAAEQAAAAEQNENVVVRRVKLDVALPIPAWVMGDPLNY